MYNNKNMLPTPVIRMPTPLVVRSVQHNQFYLYIPIGNIVYLSVGSKQDYWGDSNN